MTVRTFAAAKQYAFDQAWTSARAHGRSKPDDSDKQIGMKIMSHLLSYIPEWEGGTMGMDDDQLEAFCARNSKLVSHEECLRALWSAMPWPETETEKQQAA